MPRYIRILASSFISQQDNGQSIQSCRKQQKTEEEKEEVKNPKYLDIYTYIGFQRI